MRITLTFIVASGLMLEGLFVGDEEVLSKEAFVAPIFFFLKVALRRSINGMPRVSAVTPLGLSALFLFDCWLLSYREEPWSLSSLRAPPLTVDIMGILVFSCPPKVCGELERAAGGDLAFGRDRTWG
jgi:hypothetical protein